MDVLYLVGIVAFFAITWAFVRLCDALGARR
jgi:hypothetical protein